MQVLKLIEYFPHIEEDILRRAKIVSYEKVKKTHKRLDRVRQVYLAIEDKYICEKSNFEHLDRELAMLDGRYQILQRRKKKKTKYGTTDDLVAELSGDQIARIAAILGVNLKENNEGGD